MAALSRDLIETGLGWQYRAGRMEAFVRHPDYAVAVARANDGMGDDLAGFAVMQFHDERAHLALLAVVPRWQRRGVATALLDWLVDCARVAGCATVHVELRERNTAAYALYRRAQFAPTLRVEGYYQGREHAVRMLRVLRDPQAVATDRDVLDAFRRR